MCGTCGCADNESDSRTIILQQKVLAKNDELAERNRSFLTDRNAAMLNLMSSPGAGKTTLLESMAGVFSELPQVSVIEGDQETALDADRIKAAGYAVVQINTGVGCHLDADMVAAALGVLDPQPGSIVIVENVGNLVCPALFDLGESARIVLASVTEGGDKPLKYPHMFRQADLVLVTKIDLLPYVDFDLERYATDVRRLNPAAELLTVSARTGEGMAAWCEWLRLAARPTHPARPDSPPGRAQPLSRPGPG
ncbi:MAG TPA: hydrogenase nickel incorporation protein HypB [Streptosporangiaceae bacterium]|jgi:hydrogenase nickel incorporation protein HypB